MFWRNPSAAFFNFVLPLLFLFAGGAILSGNQRDLDKLLPSIAALSVMSTTFTALAYNIVYLRERGVLKRVRGTPLPTVSYFGGVMANAVTNAALQIAIVVLAGKLVFGIGWPRDWAQLAVFVVAGVACLSALGVAFAHLIPNFESTAAYVNAVFLPVVFVSFYVFDSSSAPDFLRNIAEALPLKPLIDGLYAAIVSGSGLGDNLDALAIIKDGRILAIGPPRELGAGSAHYRVSYRGAGGELVERQTDDPTRLLHELTGEALARGERLEDLAVRRPTLEELYLELTADG